MMETLFDFGNDFDIVRLSSRNFNMMKVCITLALIYTEINSCIYIYIHEKYSIQLVNLQSYLEL